MPYTTKLLDENNKELPFETLIGPSTRGKKYIAFDVFVGQGVERKKVGSMDYNVKLDSIHINRMDNFSNAFGSTSTGIIKHMGYLFLEHAMRESFVRGSKGRLGLEVN